MYKTYYFLERSGSGDPFRAHGDDARNWLDAMLPHASGFAQTRTTPEQVEAEAKPAFAGAVETWHARLADALAAGERERIEGALAPGTRVACAYTGLARTVMRLQAHLHEASMKLVFPFRRKAGMSVDAFRKRWWHGHGPIAARTERALFYLQCHPLEESYAGGAEPRFDGVTELHFPSLALARAAMASEQMRVEQGNDAPHFAAPGSVLMFAASEEIVRAP
jgi:uncharacterized protein (TIGR02118 family)